MLQQTLAYPESLLNRFNCGNLETLQLEGIREQLLSFHKTWYSANIMKLVVSGKHSLEQLEQWVVAMFSEVENKDVVVPNLGLPKMPYDQDNLGTIQRFKPIQDKDKLMIYWILPYCEKEYKTQPLRYFSHLFGHEGENSLLSYLAQEGYALGLSAGEDHEMGIYSDFYLDIALTKKGLENYEKVAQAVFKYAQRLVETGPQNFVHEECKTLGKIKFDFADKGEAIRYCINLASRMQNFETPEDLPHLLR
jgi:insulysin